MKFIKFILATMFRRVIPPALRGCEIDSTAVVLSSSRLTRVTMGRYSYCGYGCTISNADIGAFCSIADGVEIGRAEHPMNFVSMSPVFHEGRNVLRKSFSQHSLPRAKTTTIGNDVWIGQGAMIKAGVTLGNGAVVGMGAIVTRDVMPYAIVVGNPARELRRRFDEDTMLRLEQSSWWDWPAEKLANRAGEFNDAQRFLSEEE